MGCLGGHRYTESLTTIGTPHKGSSWVDIQHWLPIVPPGYRNLTSNYVTEKFNPQAEDHPDVKYYSVVGYMDKVSPLDVLYVPYSYIKDAEGENDGLVSTSSQEWGTVMERVPLCHHKQHFSN